MGYRKVTVGTTPTIIVAFNSKRSALTIYNPGPATVYVSDKQTNIIEEGFPVGPGVYIGWAKVDGDETEYAVYGQVESGTQDIRVQESYGEVAKR
jgi:hypothetical protein